MMRNRTLLIVDPGLRLWGSERALAATLRALTEAWGRVVLVTPAGAELAKEVRTYPDRYGPISVLQAPIGMLHKRGRAAQLRAMLVLAALIIRLRPARLYLNQAGLARLLVLVCRMLGVPIAVHVRLIDDVPRLTALRGNAKAPLELIAVSRAMLDAFDLCDGKYRRLHFAYDPYQLTEPLANVADPARPTFVSVGRLSHLKGVHLLIAALADPRLRQARATIYGAGVEGDSYADDLALQARPLVDRVAFEGFQRDVLARLPGHGYLVLTSAYETLGRVVIEAWDAGLVPIVYSGSGGAAEIVTASNGGFIFDEWTTEALVPVLAKAMALSEMERQAIAARGRAWAAIALDLGRYRAALRGVLF